MSDAAASISRENLRFIWAIVAAQVLVQIGAFSLPALLPAYIERWYLSKTEAGWLVGIFFAAYVVAVPVLVSLTDRMPTRRVYAARREPHRAVASRLCLPRRWVLDGVDLRALAGIGWAGAYMPGLKAITDHARRHRAVARRVMACGRRRRRRRRLLRRRRTDRAFVGPDAAFLFGGIAALLALRSPGLVMPTACRSSDAQPTPRAAARFPAGVSQPRGDGMDRGLHGPHLGDWRRCAPGA